MTFVEISEHFKNKLETHPLEEVVKGLVLLFKYLKLKEEEKKGLHFLLRFNSIQTNFEGNAESLTVETNKFIQNLIHWIDNIGDFSYPTYLPESIDQFFPKKANEGSSLRQPYNDLIDYFKFRAKMIIEAVQNSDQYYELISQLTKFRELHEFHIQAIEKGNLILAHEILWQIHHLRDLKQLLTENMSQNLIYNNPLRKSQYLVRFYTEEISSQLLSFRPSDENQETKASECYIEVLQKFSAS